MRLIRIYESDLMWCYINLDCSDIVIGVKHQGKVLETFSIDIRSLYETLEKCLKGRN